MHRLPLNVRLSLNILCTLCLGPLLILQLAGCTTTDEPAPGPAKPTAASFRTHGDYFQIDRHDGQGWQKFIINGVNLAIAKPGFYPGELAATRADYDRWLAEIAAMKANVIRLYTLHYPIFYEAFRDWNLQHPDQPLYLMHGIWLDEREHGDYMTDSTADFEQEVRWDIDAIHGNVDIAERFGKASGKYRADASPWLLSWLPGNEMDGALVAASNAKWQGYNTYKGRFLRMPKGGLPLEGWTAQQMDKVLAYEFDRYGDLRPIGWSSWPALDPIHHPTEAPNFGQDTVDCNFAKFELVPPYDKGIFASYHIYPFNPEFIIYDPRYVATLDTFGLHNNYLGYMKDLKAHHPGIPVLVAEYGIPSSFGVAHVNAINYNHGGYNEVEQADIVYDLYHTCLEAGMAGTVAFEWIDEWFKRTWVTTPTMLPADRGRLWWDAMSPEESFGILSYYPIPGWSKQVDGKGDDWSADDWTVTNQSAAPVGPSPSAARSLESLQMAADPAFLYLKLQLADKTTTPDLDQLTVVIGLSTVEGKFGNHLVAGLQTSEGIPVTTDADLGFESLIVLDGKTRELRVDQTYSPMGKINGESKNGGTPAETSDGVFVVEQQMVNNNAQYASMDIEIDGKTWLPPPKQYHPWGVLRTGDATADTLSNLQAGPGGVLEIRIPWHAIWVTDPSSRSVMWNDPATPDWDVQVTPGIRAFVATAHAKPGAAAGTWLVDDALPRSAMLSSKTAGGLNPAAMPIFAWKTWDSVPSTGERRKPLFYALQTAFGEPVK